MTPARRHVFLSLGTLGFVLLVSACAHQPGAPQPAAAPVPQALPTPKVSAHLNQWSTNWTPIFDGRTLTNWVVTDFAGHGVVAAADGQINIAMGAEMSGINWTNGTLPKTDYEISLDAVKVDGGDFFCGLTFPVADSYCSLILGGWGGGVVGLSSLDGNDASENETTRSMSFPTGQWYRVRVCVTPEKIEAWLDKDKIIDASIVGRKVSLRPGPIALSQPLGVATYETSAAIRDIKLRLIEH